MTNEEIEREIGHLATKEELHKEIAGLLKWMILLHTPTWLGIIGTLITILHK